MRRVLFVDDEQSVLDGLQNLFHRQRRAWHMVFATSGAAALEELAKQTFDVIVSDMRMPGMDGAELLRRAKELHPGVARIVLSGHADRDAVLRVVPVAHQFLAKPCDAEALRIVIERTCSLQERLADDGLRQLIGRIDRLPSAPRTHVEIARAIADPKSSAADLARIVGEDPAMSAKVLQLVNSSYFGLARRITSIREAVAWLGTELLKALAMTAQVFAIAEGQAIDTAAVAQLQVEALLTARVAKRFFGDAPRAEEAFTAGLLHDVGKIVVAAVLPQKFAEIAATLRQGERRFHEVERDVLGTSHAELGAHLLGMWGLPFPIVEAVAFHHDPARVSEGDRALLAVVHAADALTESARRGERVAAAVDVAFLEQAGFGGRLDAWRALVDAEVARLHEGLA